MVIQSWPALGSAGIACGFQRNIHDLDHHCRRLTLSLLGWFSILSDFPTDPDYGLNSITWVEVLFAFCVANREMVFDLITYGIRMILDP